MGQNLFIAAYNKFQLGEGPKSRLPPGYTPLYQYPKTGQDVNGKDTNGDGKGEIDCTGLLSQALSDAGYQGYGRLSTAKLIGRDGKFSEYARVAFDVVGDGKGVLSSADLAVGDILVFRSPSGGNGHVGIFIGYQNGIAQFYGSQSSTGPAIAGAGIGTFWNGSGREIVGALRPTKASYDPAKDTTLTVTPTPESQQGFLTQAFATLAAANEALRQAVKGEYDAVVGRVNDAVNQATRLAEDARESFLNSLGQFQIEGQGLLDGLERAGTDFPDRISQILAMLSRHLDTTVGTAGQDFIDLALGLSSWLHKTSDILSEEADSAYQRLLDALETINLPSAQQVVQHALNNLIENGRQLASEAYESVARAIKISFPDGLFRDELATISATTATSFLAARTVAALRHDPLILDLDGDGLETIGINPASPILFDHDGDGVKTATGWVRSDDAFLVLDRNGNNAIDNGSELFGDATPLYAGGLAADGFAALAQEDSNHDGKVDSLDARFANLRLWRDLNQDGISQAGELFTLASQGITALNVARTANATLLANGNQIADLGGFVRSNGTGGTLGAVEQLADINLASSPFYSQFTNSIPLTEAALNLADMQGAGMVRSLREAACLPGAQGSALAAQLAAFAADTTRSGQLARLEPLLKAWSDTSTMATTASGAFAGVNLTVSFAGVANGTPAYQAWLDKLSILERFNGQTFLPVPAAGTTLAIDFHAAREAALDAAYAALKESVYCALVKQTRLKPLLSTVRVRSTREALTPDCTRPHATVDAHLAANAGRGPGLIDSSQSTQSLLAGSGGGEVTWIRTALERAANESLWAVAA